MAHVTDQERAWRASGAMALTGRADGPPLVAPDGVVDRMRALGAGLGVDVLALLAERAAIAGHRRAGAVSCGGASRLLRAADGWVAVSLARDDDVVSVPAWLELDGDAGGDDGDADGDPWPAVVAAVAGRPVAWVEERGLLLGLPVAVVPEVGGPGEGGGSRTDGPFAGLPVRAGALGPPARPVRPEPLVVDLSSLWAGPLCARLLGDAGARVVKVESVHRSDGARRGPAAFFDLLHAGHESVALDFATPAGVGQLRRLLAAADVVVESSRPRALEQLGIDAAGCVAAGTAVWVSITGHGRAGAGRERVAFGDDAAAGGGLVAFDDDGPCFVADAVADPLTGITAAAAAVAALDDGGGWLLDVPMTAVASHVAGGATGGRWRPGADADASPPTAPEPVGPAPDLGAHTAAVLAELDAHR